MELLVLEDNKIKLDENGCIALSDNAQDILCNAMLQALTTALGDDLNDLAKLYNDAKTKSYNYSESITKADEVIEYERQQVVRLQTIIDNMKIATNNQASVNKSTSEQLAKHVNLVKKYEKENKLLAEENEKLKKANQKLKKDLQDLKGKINSRLNIIKPKFDKYSKDIKLLSQMLDRFEQDSIYYSSEIVMQGVYSQQIFEHKNGCNLHVKKVPIACQEFDIIGAIQKSYPMIDPTCNYFMATGRPDLGYLVYFKSLDENDPMISIKPTDLVGGSKACRDWMLNEFKEHPVMDMEHLENECNLVKTVRDFHEKLKTVNQAMTHIGKEVEQLNMTIKGL